MGGWGEDKGPTLEEKALRAQLDAASALAASVRCWEAVPSMNNQERMLQRLQAYETLIR